MIADLYAQKKTSETDALGPWHRAGMTLLAEFLKDRAAATIVDLGCGTGVFFEALKARFPEKSLHAKGIDANPRNLELCAKKGIDALRADLAEPIPMASASVDVVVCFEVVEHMFDPKVLLSEAFRILKPGGLLLLSTPNAFHAGRALSFMRGELRDPLLDPSSGLVPEHVRLYGVQSLGRLLRGAGFATVRFFGVTRAHIFSIPWMVRWFGQGLLARCIK